MFQRILKGAVQGAKNVFSSHPRKKEQFEDAEWSRLNKQATAQKKAGDIDLAVATLQKLKAMCGGDYADTRLAKYLQQAGKFEEAMQEIEWLNATSGAWAQRLFGHQSATVIQCQRAGWCSRIHAAAVLICKRENNVDLQAAHQELYERYATINRRLYELEKADKTKARG